MPSTPNEKQDNPITILAEPLTVERDADAAEKALLAIGLDICPDEEIEQWNATRNNGGQPYPDVRLEGWKEDGGFLYKEFYVTDPTGENVALYRKAYYDEWEGTNGRSIILADHDGNKVSLPEGHAPNDDNGNSPR